MENRGAVNIYICTECKHKHVTINLNTGTTPFGIICRVCECPNAYSQFYNLPSGKIICHYVWYRPSKIQFYCQDECTQDHILRGGLILGRIEDNITPLTDPKNILNFNLTDFLNYMISVYGVNSERIKKHV